RGVAVGGRVRGGPRAAGRRRRPRAPAFAEPALNRFLAAGPAAWREARERVTEWLTSPAHRTVVAPHLVPRGEVRLHLPFAVADYVDFYPSRNHPENPAPTFPPAPPPPP